MLAREASEYVSSHGGTLSVFSVFSLARKARVPYHYIAIVNQRGNLQCSADYDRDKLIPALDEYIKKGKQPMKITIKKSPSADTRSADHIISRDELLTSTEMHIDDVRKAMQFIRRQIYNAALRHDFTKLSRFVEFYEQFHEAQTTGHWGIGWFDQIHIVEERHHLKDRCPEDVNLIDVLEMLCDCVMAGLARTGQYRDEEPDAEILVKAYKNTVKMLLENTEVTDK